VSSEDSIAVLRAAAVPLEGVDDAAAVLEQIPESADFVLLGEASHGTHEFYQLRGDVTKLLIQERGFNAVATEADFPDAQRANMWVQHLSDRDNTADEALSEFTRFPTWMWRNREVVSFLGWLHAHNATIPADEEVQRKVGFQGLDIYSLAASSDSVIKFLEEMDPAAAQRARGRYGCFDKYGADAISYAFSLAKGSTGCEADAIGQLVDMLEQVGQRVQDADGSLESLEKGFAAVANARVVKGAEEYYRSMFFAEDLTWNVRDTHMTETATHLHEYLSTQRKIQRPKIAIWAHNSHLGDARSTCMGRRRGEVNLGQLLREKYGEDRVYIVGQMAYSGTVSAAPQWNAPVEKMDLRPAAEGSHEALLHQAGLPAFCLDLRNAPKALAATLEYSRLQRSVGVIYCNTDADQELKSHYFTAWLRRQFDLLVFRDTSSATEPIEDGAQQNGAEQNDVQQEDAQEEDGEIDGKSGHPQPDGIDSPGGENQDGCCCADDTKTSYTQDDIKADTGAGSHGRFDV
jgi:erythromycin esterase-like protein